MDEADFLSDRIAFLTEGKVIAEGNADDLKRRLQFGDVIKILYAGPPFRPAWLSSLDGILKADFEEGLITLSVDDHQKRLDPLIRILHPSETLN